MEGEYGGGESFDATDSEQSEQPAKHKRVQDEVEAEHMAHAMDPHYERASQIEKIIPQGRDATDKQKELDAKDLIPDEIYEQGDPAIQAQAGDEAGSLLERESQVAYEREALDEAASSARKAGDAAGELRSQIYRRKHPPDPSA